MSKRQLRAVVIGAGWAGEGHTKALQHAGVEVAAICARTPEVVQKVADGLGVPEASTDWQRTLETVKPDVVALATPASLRGDVVQAAVEMGCHLLCDKPLALTAGDAKRLYRLVEGAAVKHAYAASHRYDPSVVWLAELLENDTIGPLQEVEVVFRFPYLSATTPWGWLDTLESGGGFLNNGLPHLLGILERVIGSQVTGVAGAARVLRQQAPLVSGIHDYREWQSTRLSPEEAANVEWRACDADNAFSALLSFTPPRPDYPKVFVQMTMNDVARDFGPTNGWYFYGQKGTLIGDGFFSLSVSRQDSADAESEPLPTPQRLLDRLPQTGGDVQNKWTALVRDFVADIRGQEHQPYLTFRDGWRYQAAIDAIRAGASWQTLPS